MYVQKQSIMQRMLPIIALNLPERTMNLHRFLCLLAVALNLLAITPYLLAVSLNLLATTPYLFAITLNLQSFAINKNEAARNSSRQPLR